MSVLISHASLDENKNIKNGQAGDQTGKEVCIREWYSKPWQYVIRFRDSRMAEKVAVCMEMAANNNLIGYDQFQRNTLLKEARKYNYDVSKVNVPCETDCSALVSVACMYAGIPESQLTLNGNCATTRTLRGILKATGEVDIYSTPAYVSHTDRLKRGDILLKEGAHTAVVVQPEPLKSVEEIAREVLKGLWGSGQTRKTMLTNAGYDYQAVQSKVNELLKPKLSIDELARQVIDRKWGNGEERRRRLTEAGYDYAAVQKRVNEILKGEKKIEDVPKYIWDYLYKEIQNPYGVAGLMGNLKAESGLNPKNLQNSFEKRTGLTDDTYTASVDSGAYGNFVSDSAGYGLAQWTYFSRKQELLNYAKSKGCSIGDLNMQLEFLYKELNTSYKGVFNALKSANTVREASDIVLTKFEKPRDQSEGVKQHRASLGQEIYDKYGGK